MAGKKGTKKESVKQEDQVSPAVKIEKPKQEEKPKNQGKKKKNAPDRPQPAWLFPPEEENPILNGKTKSKEQIKKEIEDRLEAVQALKNKAASAPNRPQPPPLLIQLVGAFLAEYGFNSTSRVFNLERSARKRIASWEDKIDAKFPKSQPNLTRIFKDWQAEWKEDTDMNSGSSSEGESTDSEAGEAVKGDLDSSESSADSDDSDDSSKPKKKKKPKETKVKVEKKAESSGKQSKGISDSSASSSSDSDADDEVVPAAPISVNGKPTINGLLEKLKARQLPLVPVTTAPVATTKKGKTQAASTPAAEPDSESSSSSEEEAPTRKKKATKSATKKQLKEEKLVKDTKEKSKKKNKKKAGSSSSSASDSSSKDSSDSESEGGVPTKATARSLAVTIEPVVRPASDSSNTLLASPVKKEASSDSTSESSDTSDSSSASEEAETSAPVVVETKTTKRKRSNDTEPAEATTTVTAKIAKKINTPFQRVPSDTKVDPKFASNKYQAYDYAQKAHEDLIVTKGKNFTKEKNKKKRGSYRGGLIDVSGGKGIKFED